MIRINLLGVSRPAARAVAGPSEGMAPEATIIPAAFLVVLILISLFVYWYWTRSITQLKQELVQQQNEQKRLAGIMEQNKLYEQTLNQYQLRVNSIESLNRSKLGPVDMMHALGNLATRSNELYLLSVVTKGDRLAMEGEANSTVAIANFIRELQHSGTFDDVQLKQSYQSDLGKRLNYKFNLDCNYRQPTTGMSTVPAAQSATTSTPANRQAGL